MKNYLVAILIGVLIVGGGAFWLVKSKPKITHPELPPQTEQPAETQVTSQPEETSSPNQNPTVDYRSVLKGYTNPCQLFPKAKIEELLGKTFHSVKNGQNKLSKYTEYYCEYYQEAPGFTYEGNVPIPSKRIVISFIEGEVKEVRESYKLSGYSIKQDDEIPFSHQLVLNQKGELQRLEIFLADDLDLVVNTFQSNLTQQEALNFVKKFASYLKEYSQNR